jgi:hypothetical protein
MGKSKEQASAPLPDQKPSKTNGTQKISTAQRIFEIFELQRAAVQLQCASTSSTSHFRCHFVTLSLSLSFACSQDSQAAEVIDRVSRRSVCLPRVLRKIHSAVTHERFLLETTREQIEQTKNCYDLRYLLRLNPPLQTATVTVSAFLGLTFQSWACTAWKYLEIAAQGMDNIGI